jgi:hypothetical protein
MPRLKTTLPILLSCLCLSLLQAQSDNLFSTEEGFRLIGISDNFDDMAYEHRGEIIQLSASSGRLSKLYPLPRAGRLEIFRELPVPANAPAGTPTPRRPLANIQLLPSASAQIVLLAPSPAGNGLRGLAIDAMTDTHTLGRARIINASAREAVLSFGGDPHRAEPKSMGTMVSFPTGISKIIVAVQGDEPNTWEQALYTQRRLSQQGRMFIILIDRQPTEGDPLPVLPVVFFDYSRPTPPPNA